MKARANWKALQGSGAHLAPDSGLSHRALCGEYVLTYDDAATVTEADACKRCMSNAGHMGLEFPEPTRRGGREAGTLGLGLAHE